MVGDVRGTSLASSEVRVESMLEMRVSTALRIVVRASTSGARRTVTAPLVMEATEEVAV